MSHIGSVAVHMFKSYVGEKLRSTNSASHSCGLGKNSSKTGKEVVGGPPLHVTHVIHAMHTYRSTLAILTRNGIPCLLPGLNIQYMGGYTV